MTAIEFRLYPLAEVYAGWLVWPMERAGEVLKAWRDWTETVPDEVTSIGRLLNLPPIPEVPEPLRGRSIVVVEAAFTGGEEEGRKLMAPLRALGPELDTSAQVPARALVRLHQDPEPPTPGSGDGSMLFELPDEAIDGVVAATGPGSPLLSTEIRHLGGALAAAKPEHGAIASLDAAYLVFTAGVPMSPEVAVAIDAAIDRVEESIASWTARQAYFNLVERAGDARPFYSDIAYARLRRVRAQYDPGRLFQANHAIG